MAAPNRSRRGRDRSRHTRLAYFRDLGTYLHWCQRQDLDPLTARQADLDEFRDYRSRPQDGQPGTTTQPAGKAPSVPAPAMVARSLAAISSWYQYLIANTVGRVGRNPLDGVERPEVPEDSPTADLTADQVDAVIATIDATAEQVLHAAGTDAAAVAATADTAGRQAGLAVLSATTDRASGQIPTEDVLLAADRAAVRAREEVFAEAIRAAADDPAVVAHISWYWAGYLSALRDRALIRILADRTAAPACRRRIRRRSTPCRSWRQRCSSFGAGAPMRSWTGRRADGRRRRSCRRARSAMCSTASRCLPGTRWSRS